MADLACMKHRFDIKLNTDTQGNQKTLIVDVNIHIYNMKCEMKTLTLSFE